jgi:hypothetical protein
VKLIARVFEHICFSADTSRLSFTFIESLFPSPFCFHFLNLPPKLAKIIRLMILFTIFALITHSTAFRALASNSTLTFQSTPFFATSLHNLSEDGTS